MPITPKTYTNLSDALTDLEVMLKAISSKPRTETLGVIQRVNFFPGMDGTQVANFKRIQQQFAALLTAERAAVMRKREAQRLARILEAYFKDHKTNNPALQAAYLAEGKPAEVFAYNQQAGDNSREYYGEQKRII